MRKERKEKQILKKGIAAIAKRTAMVLSSKLNTASSVTLKQVFYSA